MVINQMIKGTFDYSYPSGIKQMAIPRFILAPNYM